MKLHRHQKTGRLLFLILLGIFVATATVVVGILVRSFLDSDNLSDADEATSSQVTEPEEIAPEPEPVLPDKIDFQPLVDEWVSTTEAHVIKGVKPGIYTLTETIAPEGYLLSQETITVEVTDTAAVTTAVMKNSWTNVSFSKQDITTGEELPGATLQVIDKNGKVLEEWVSSNTPHTIDTLPAGDYILREEIAPDGYLAAEDVEFAVTDNGVSQKVVMKDDYTKIEVVKLDDVTSERIEGALLVVLDQDGNALDEWTSNAEAHRIDRLAPGKYILRELLAPEGHLDTTDIEFTVEATADIQLIEMVDTPIQIKGEIDKRQTIADSDNTFLYTVDYRNCSNTWVDELNMTDSLDCAISGLARLTSVTTPVSSGDSDGLMNVWYQTNLNDKSDSSDAELYNACSSNPNNPYNIQQERVADFTGWTLWKAGVSTASAVTLDVGDLNLEAGEYVTAVRFEHGRVAEGFSTCMDESIWIRTDLKSENDSISGYVANPSDEISVGSPAVFEMVATAALNEKVTLINEADIDLHRNLVLHDYDEDTVVQQVGVLFDKTGDMSDELPFIVAFGILLTVLGGLAIVLLQIKRFNR